MHHRSHLLCCDATLTDGHGHTAGATLPFLPPPFVPADPRKNAGVWCSCGLGVRRRTVEEPSFPIAVAPSPQLFFFCDLHSFRRDCRETGKTVPPQALQDLTFLPLFSCFPYAPFLHALVPSCTHHDSQCKRSVLGNSYSITRTS